MAAVITSRTITSSVNLSRSLFVSHVRLLPSKGASAKRPHLSYATNPAFANPTGSRYDAEDAKLAWKRTLAFLRTHLR